MGTITLSVPDKLKENMGKTDFINWSAVARRAFAKTLSDIEELEMIKKVREISEIAEGDKREVKESVVKGVIKSVEKISKDLRSGKIKPKTLKEFNEWCSS